MKQQNFAGRNVLKEDRSITLWESKLNRNPTVYQVGAVFNKEVGSFVEVNGKPGFKQDAE